MKEKLHYAIEAVLVVAVIILFVFQFSDNKKSSKADNAISEGKGESGETMPIAYIDVDSLMSNYTYSIDLNEQLTKKAENSRVNLATRMRRVETELAEFQRKYEANAFLSQDRAKSEYDRIMKLQEDLRVYEAQITQEFNEEQFRVSEELRKTIISQLREYNKSKGYHIVYGKMNDNILYSDDVYNITADVIDFFNKNHATSPAAKTNE